MAASLPPVRRRRRPRRGSIERPVDGRLYRSAFLVVLLPLLILAFSIIRATPLPAPLLPPANGADATFQLAKEFATKFPDRAPGTSGSVGAADWFTAQLKLYGLPPSSDTWRETVPGLGRVELQNIWSIAPGKSSDAIVVLAHRDDSGVGPGANDNASGTAELVELARGYGVPTTVGAAAVKPTHTLIFLSSDGGAFGGLGALRFIEHPPTRGRIRAVINLDALGGAGPPRLEISGDLPHTPSRTLVQTAARRILEQTGRRPQHPGLFAQLVDLGFPLTLYEQGPFVARGISAVTMTTGRTRPPPAFVDNINHLRAKKLAGMGLAAQELLASLDQGLELTQSTTSFVWVGNRTISGWAIELVLISLLVPYLVGVVDLFAFCRRRRIPLRAALRALQSRLAFWLLVGLIFAGFRLFGAFPDGPPRPPNPGFPATGTWPVVALIALGVVIGGAWLLARTRLRPQGHLNPEQEIAGHAVALLALGVVGLLIVATNPFALLFALPPLHLWLWLPAVRRARVPLRLLVFALGLAGPLIVVASLGWRFDLGFDAPWYLLQLVSVGYVTLPAVLIALIGAAAAAQLAAASAGRYAPYPASGERGPGGPVRAVVRTVFLALGAGGRRFPVKTGYRGR